jgi:hypothetical protein
MHEPSAVRTSVPEASAQSAPVGERAPGWASAQGSRVDIGAIISKALAAAGLMKE